MLNRLDHGSSAQNSESCIHNHEIRITVFLYTHFGVLYTALTTKIDHNG